MYSTYQRLKVLAYDSNSTVIRAAKSKLRPEVWYTREHRTARHQFYRDVLKYHAKSRDIYRMCTVGVY